MAKQLKKFCRITKYIEKTDPKLHEILDDLCVLGSFRPRRGHNGITFIWPSKDTIAKLDKMRWSEDIDKGCDIVLAHIIHDFLPNAAAWNTKKSDIPNGLNKKIEVKEVKGNKITLIDGSELEQDPKFRTFSRGDENQAVYEIKKGSLDPSKYTKSASFEHARQTTGAPVKRPEPTHGGGKEGQKEVVNRLAAAMAQAIFDVRGGKEKNSSSIDGMLVDLYTLIKEDGVKDHLAYLALLLRPLPITTAAFVLCEKDKILPPYIERLRELCQDPSSKYGKNLYGRKAYLTMMHEAHTVFQGIRGGSSRQELNNALSQAIKDALDDSDKAVTPYKNGLPQIDWPEFVRSFTNLNMACHLEYQTMSEAANDSTLSLEDLQSNFAECASVILDRANDSTTDTDASSSKLGPFIASLLVAVRKFSESEYAVYPTNLSKYKSANIASESLVGKYTMDTSAHSIFSGITADSFSAFLASLTAADDASAVDAAEEAPLE